MNGRRMEPAVWIGLVSMLLVTLVAVFAVISFQNTNPRTDTAPVPGQTAAPSGGGWRRTGRGPG